MKIIDAPRLVASLREVAMSQKDNVMKAITVRDRESGAGGLSLMALPCPHAAQNEVIVRPCWARPDAERAWP